MSAVDLAALRTHRNIFLASIAIFIYDYFCTLDREVSTVWKGCLGLASSLFFIARYATLIDHTAWLIMQFFPSSLSLPTCHGAFIVLDIFAFLSIAASDAVLVLTLYVLLGSKQHHKVMLSVFCALNTALALALVLTFVIQAEPISPSEIDMGINCTFIFPSINYLLISYFVLLAGEVVLTVFALWFGWTEYRRTRSHLMAILYEDGIFYYVIILWFTVLNIVAPHVLPDIYGGMFQGFQRVMHPILACRLVFDAREKARGLIPGERNGSSTGSPVLFLCYRSSNRMQVPSIGLATFGTSSSAATIVASEEDNLRKDNAKAHVW
ncbi:hypothetical protein BKA70DRAFT_1278469 [Coprinopsis sp. MPI-PUGE-AT-0042]|nr:hypothetical protein BKA70DRAFT_1278469 [Coprinopsis sp. MPI-PUGE-AT-0042]